MLYLGLDPGQSGGIAAIHNDEVVAVSMPVTERDILDTLHRMTALNAVDFDGSLGPKRYQAHVVIEHVWSIPGQGGAFKFGKNVGTLLGILTAVEIPFDQILPRVWQKALGVVYPKGATDTAKKNITKRRAQQLFPSITVTHKTADALLLAEYCRRLHTGARMTPGSIDAIRATDYAIERMLTNGKAESLTRTEGTYEDPVAAHTIPVWTEDGVEVYQPKAEQGRGRARVAQRPDPSPQRPRAGRAAGDGKHGRRPQDG